MNVKRFKNEKSCTLFIDCTTFMFILSTSNLHKIHWNFLLWCKPSSGLKACFTFVNLLKRLQIHVQSPHSETKLQGQLWHRVSITSMQHHQVQTRTKRASHTQLPQPPFNQHCSVPQMATLTANANNKLLSGTSSRFTTNHSNMCRGMAVDRHQLHACCLCSSSPHLQTRP